MTGNYTEKYRPQFHFTPEQNWMNDPNGMVFFNNEYHLFYQYHPFSTLWGPMHWGHAVSKDLIHWEHLPIALSPDEHGAIFSGSAVVDWNNKSGFFDEEPGLVAIYTSADTYPNSNRERQRQSIAYSKDNGRTWIKYEGNPILADEKITDYRDPKVFWHHETNQWVMILATGQTVMIYTSLNLKDWEFASEFGHQAGSHAGVWECPDLFKLPIDGDDTNQKWVMIVSIGDDPKFKEGSRTQYFVGDFDGKTFVNDYPDDTILWLDYGRDNYAGVSWSDIPEEDGRRIYIGWMSNWRYAREVPTEGWRSAMTLPRELSLISTTEGVRVAQFPVRELVALESDRESYNNLTINDNSPITYQIDELMKVELDFENQFASSFGVVFKNSANDQTVISYNKAKGLLQVDRTTSGNINFSETFATIQEAPLKLIDEKIKLQIYIDTSSIEVFVNKGEIAITSLIFPKEPLNELELFSIDGITNVSKLTFSKLKSIWNR